MKNYKELNEIGANNIDKDGICGYCFSTFDVEVKTQKNWNIKKFTCTKCGNTSTHSK